jgi:hypothetical protein
MDIEESNETIIMTDPLYNIKNKENIKNSIDVFSSDSLPKTSLKQDSKKVEKVLILQGGGSLGAFGWSLQDPQKERYKSRFNRRNVHWWY